jgi:hypothetical protein
MTLCGAAVNTHEHGAGNNMTVKTSLSPPVRKGSQKSSYFLDTNPDIYLMHCPGTQCLLCLWERWPRREYSDSVLQEPFRTHLARG